MKPVPGELFARFRENYDSIAKRSWRAPLAVSDTAASDLDSWITYPACYPHLIRYPDDDDNYFYALRIRDVAGCLKVLTNPIPDAMHAARQLEMLWFELGCALEYMRERDDEDVNERYPAYVDDVLEVEFAGLSKAADPLWSSPLAPIELETGEYQFCATVPHWLPVLRRIVRPNGRVSFKGFLPRPWPIMFIPEIAKADPSEEIASLQEALAEMYFAHGIYRDCILDKAKILYAGFCRRRGFTEPRPTFEGVEISASSETTNTNPRECG